MVTKAVLAKEIRKSASLSYRDASACIDILIEAFAQYLAKGETIELRGLGTFDVKVKPEKKYPSLLSDQKLVPAHGRVVFKPSRKLREAVWNIPASPERSASRA